MLIPWQNRKFRDAEGAYFCHMDYGVKIIMLLNITFLLKNLRNSRKIRNFALGNK